MQAKLPGRFRDGAACTASRAQLVLRSRYPALIAQEHLNYLNGDDAAQPLWPPVRRGAGGSPQRRCSAQRHPAPQGRAQEPGCVCEEPFHQLGGGLEVQRGRVDMARRWFELRGMARTDRCLCCDRRSAGRGRRLVAPGARWAAQTVPWQTWQRALRAAGDACGAPALFSVHAAATALATASDTRVLGVLPAGNAQRPCCGAGAPHLTPTHPQRHTPCAPRLPPQSPPLAPPSQSQRWWGSSSTRRQG